MGAVTWSVFSILHLLQKNRIRNGRWQPRRIGWYLESSPCKAENSELIPQDKGSWKREKISQGWKRENRGENKECIEKLKGRSSEMESRPSSQWKAGCHWALTSSSMWLHLLLLAPAGVSKSTSLTISCPDSEAGRKHCAAPHVSIIAWSPYMAADLPSCWSKKSPSMPRKCFYSLPLSTCCPNYRGLMFQWPWCGHTSSLGEFFKVFWMTSKNKVVKMTCLCIKALDYMSVYPITNYQKQISHTPKVGSSTSEASANNFASKSDQQLYHYCSPQLHSNDWNHETVKNRLTKKIRRDLLFNQTVQMWKIIQFHSKSTDYGTVMVWYPGVDWCGMHSPLVSTDIPHCVCFPCGSYSQVSGMNIPLMWAPCMAKYWETFMLSWLPLARLWELYISIRAAAAKFWSESKFPKAVLRWFSSLLKSTEF